MQVRSSAKERIYLCVRHDRLFNVTNDFNWPFATISISKEEFNQILDTLENISLVISRVTFFYTNELLGLPKKQGVRATHIT